MTADTLVDTGLLIAVNHEPLSFLRRVGHASVDAERRFLEDHREENVRKLAERGCNWVRIHFYKGFGIEAERDEMALAREFVQTCHRHRIKVQLYVQFGTLQTETLLAERPDAMDWVQRDEDGRPITLLYGHQTFRHYPCFNREGYWDYLERVIDAAVKDCSADGLGLDNISTSEEPIVCRCESCSRAFVAFLKERWPVDTPDGERRARERFGHTILDHIRPPAWNYFNHPCNLREIVDPVLQEWIDFRCESLHRILKRLHDHAKALNSNVLVELNAYKHFGTNTAFVHGIYLPDLADSLDAFWNECEPFPGLTADGRLLAKVRGYKMARAMGRVVFTNHPASAPEPAKHLAYAEALVFNRGLIGGIEGAEPIYSGRETSFRSLQAFRAAHPEIYRAESAAAVALYESRASLANHAFKTVHADLVVQQALLRAHVPFDLVFDLRGLERYRLLILPDAECLSRGEIERLLDHVRSGAGILMTGASGDFDQWRRPWGAGSLRPLLGLGSSLPSRAGSSAGSGRVVALPDLETDTPLEPEAEPFMHFGSNQPMVGLEHWKGPKDLEAVVEAITWAIGGSLPVEVEAPQHVVIDLQRSRDGTRMHLHLLNYQAGSEVAGIRVRFAGELVAAGEPAICASPEADGDAPSSPDGSGWITLPPFTCYLVATVPAKAAQG